VPATQSWIGGCCWEGKWKKKKKKWPSLITSLVDGELREIDGW
jgi:hypothetical protein